MWYTGSPICALGYSSYWPRSNRAGNCSVLIRGRVHTPNGTANVRAKASPCSANALPDFASVARVFAAEPVAVRQWEQVIALRFQTAHAFLRHLKRTGAHTPARLSALGPAQLRRFLRGWDRDCPNGVEVTCAIHYLSVEKAGDCGG